MKFTFIHKILSILLVIIFLIAGFVLVSNTQQLISELETQPENSQTFLFILLIISGFGLFILTLFRPKKEVVIEKFIQQEKTQEEESTSETEDESKKITLLSEEELIKEANELFPDGNIENLEAYTEKLLANISKKIEIVQGLVFIREQKDDLFKVSGKYAYFSDDPPKDFKEGESISGQVAKNQKLINIDDIPEGYVKIISGLGTGYPRHLLIAPGIANNKTMGIIEVASFKELDKNFENLIQVIANKLVEKINKVTKD